MNKYPFLLLIIVLTSCIVTPPPIEATPTRYIPTAKSTPKPTSSPRPTSSPVPPTPTLTPFLRSLQIVYTGGSYIPSIYTWQAGTVTKLVKEDYFIPCGPVNCNNLLLSDDNQLIAYTTQVEDYELSVVNKDGSEQKLLVDFNELPGTTYLYGMGWLPNTHLIWFTTLDQGYGFSYAFSNDLYIVNADTGELREILPPGEGGDIYPSPNGKYLAVVKPYRIEIREVDGRKTLSRLDFEYTDPPRDYPQYPVIATYPIPIWAKDSSSLVVAILSSDVSDDNTVKANIWRLSVTTPTPQLVSQTVATPDMHMKLPYSSQPLAKLEPRRYPISISPDLTWFIYSRTNSDRAAELHLATLDLSSDTIVHMGEPGYEYVVDWLPSSTEFFIIQREKEHLEGRGYFLGNIEGLVEPFPLNEVTYRIDWLNDESYLYVNKVFDLRLGIRGEPKSMLIERNFSPLFDTYDLLK